ncbi:MAG: PEP-CTERM sorting domain-containing protein [Verrucomicrobiota bacterium]
MNSALHKILLIPPFLFASMAAAQIINVRDPGFDGTVTDGGTGDTLLSEPGLFTSDWTTGTRLGVGWSFSTVGAPDAAALENTTRMFSLVQSINVTGVSTTASPFTFSIDAARTGTGDLTTNIGIRIYSWAIGETAPRIDQNKSQTDWTSLFEDPGDASLLLSQQLVSEGDFVTAGGLVAGELTGTYTSNFVLPENHAFVSIVFSGRSNPSASASFDDLSIVVVPEPSSFGLFAGALAASCLLLRRQRHS